MQAVADRVGVRAPSLYKRLEDRDHLVRLILEDVARDLAATLDAATGGGDPARALRAQADALRAFARDEPAAYSLLFAPLPEAARPDRDLLARASAAVLRTAGALAGEAHALEGARLVTAWAHGFITMELAGAFRLGGDLEDAFAFGVERLAAALADGRAATSTGG